MVLLSVFGFKAGGGQELGVKLFVVAVCFCFGAGASQLPGCEGEGGRALEFGGGVVVGFGFGAGGGQSASGL